MLPLFDEPKPAVDRVVPGTDRYFAWWDGFRKGSQNQSAPAPEPDERVTAYAKSGFRIGRLFRPLPCMQRKER